MNEEQFNPWRYNPLNLNDKEIGDALLVIEDFFSADDVPGHLKVLENWRSAILEDRFYSDHKGSPAGILFAYQLHIKLVEAIYLLGRPERGEVMMLIALHSMEQLQMEKDNWGYFPNNLSEQELLNPFLILKEFFKDFSLPQYRIIFYEWLEHSLSAKAANEFIDILDFIRIYEGLQRLYSAAWLIYQRTTEKPYLKEAVISTANEVVKPQDINLHQLNTSLPAEKKQKLISKLITVIKHKIDTVQAVIYLGAPPNEPDNLFLLILTSNEEQRQAYGLSATIAESCAELAKITALVHHGSVLFNGLKNGNRFFNKALACPVIYLSGNLLLPAPGLYIQRGDQDGNFLWERWHKQGLQFLSGAKYYLQNDAAGPALFSLHQCVECLLTAIIRKVLGYWINNHNLSTLLNISRMFTEDLAAVFNLADGESLERFTQLKNAYVNVRYKDTFEPDTKSLAALYRVTIEFVTVTEVIYHKHLLQSSL